jgi:hypothetical protein
LLYYPSDEKQCLKIEIRERIRIKRLVIIETKNGGRT